MIKGWEEIEVRFDKIKNQQTRASKNLKEFGEILSSAYILNSNKGVEMWEYIVDLNVTNNVDNAKFFVAQIFNKILDFIGCEDASEYIGKSDRILKLLVQNGYGPTGTGLKCIMALIKGYLIQNQMQLAKQVIDYLVNSNMDFENSTEAEFLLNLVEYTEEFGNQEEINSDCSKIVENFFSECMELNNEYLDIIIFSNKIKKLNNKELADLYNLKDYIIECCRRLARMGLGELSLTLIKKLSIITDIDCIIGIWEECIDIHYKNTKLMKPHFEEDLVWFADQVNKSEYLLSYYMNSRFFDYFQKNILVQSIINNKWDNFTYILIRMISYIGTPLDRSNFKTFICKIVDLIDPNDCLVKSDGLYIEEYQVPYIVDSLLEALIHSLKQNYYEYFHNIVVNAVIKIRGNDKDLKRFGINGDLTNFNAVKRLWDLSKKYYCDKDHGVWINHDYETNMSYMIRDILSDALDEYPSRNYQYTYEFEQEIVKIDDICNYLFLNNKGNCSLKAKMIYSCILKNNINKSLDLFNLLVQTTKYDDYEERNSWQMEFENTIYYLIEEARRNDLNNSKHILDIKSIVDMSYKYISNEKISQIKINMSRVYRDEESEDIMINNIMNDINLYTSDNIVRNINSLTTNIREGIEWLIEKRKINIVSSIVDKLIDSKNKIQGVSLENWIDFIIRNYYLEEYDCYILINNNPVLLDYIGNLSEYDKNKILDIFEDKGRKFELDRVKEKLMV